jgi:hypothetical protein
VEVVAVDPRITGKRVLNSFDSAMCTVQWSNGKVALF